MDLQAVGRTDVMMLLKERSARASVLRLAGLLLAATAIRLRELGAGMWFDEVITYLKYARLPYLEIVTTYDSQNQHTLYSLLAHTAFLAFGETVAALRLPAVLFGVGSIAAVYLLGSEIASRREGLLAAALLTFSYHHVWFSQNARGYTAILFFTLLSGWLFVRGLRQPRLRIWLAYAVAAALGVYAHLTVLFIIAGHGVTWALRLLWSRLRRSEAQRPAGNALLPLAGFVAAGLLILVLYAPVLPELLGGEAAAGKVDPVSSPWKSPLWTLLELLRGLQVGFAGGALALIAGAIALVGAWSYLRTRPILLELAVVPVLINAAAVIGLHHHVWPRFFFFALGFGALILVRGALILGSAVAQRLRLNGPRMAWVELAPALVIILASAASVPAAYGPKQDYESALAYVSSARQPGDQVVMAGLAAVPYREYYKVDWPEVATATELNATRATAARTWLLYTLPIHLRANHPDLVAEIDRDFRVMRRFEGTLNDGEIVVVVADGPAKELSRGQ